ncbi:uncharacterized protein LOC122399435 [Colletes gigas]|uniref:uncharacterized protein LOC122399435 n=1 Tax=Colletes gigas TaxID=935657 RepID=UPI001C9A84BB|nr:uncharacterized protein LOC122399435 [Colletes gigas]
MKLAYFLLALLLASAVLCEKKDDGKKDEGKKDEGKKDEGKKDEGKKDDDKKGDEEGEEEPSKLEEGLKQYQEMIISLPGGELLRPHFERSNDMMKMFFSKAKRHRRSLLEAAMPQEVQG